MTHQDAFMCHGSCIFLLLNVGLVMVISLGPPCFLKTHGVQSQLGGANCSSKVWSRHCFEWWYGSFHLCTMSISSTVKLKDHRRPVWSTTKSVGRSFNYLLYQLILSKIVQSHTFIVSFILPLLCVLDYEMSSCLGAVLHWAKTTLLQGNSAHVIIFMIEFSLWDNKGVCEMKSFWLKM